MEREHLGSRLGFILLSAGCAIGLGNVWKFPYMVGENGGGLFVLIYVLFLLMFGLPILCMEFSMGRASRRSPLKMYDDLEPKGSKWHLHGYIALMGAVVLMMFYTVVSGWMLKYAIASATGDFSGMDIDGVANYFDAMVSDPLPMLVFTAIVVIVGFVICSFRVDKGLERVSKFMMIALLVLMAILMVNSLTLDGAMSGLEFYLMPDLDKLLEK
jgi:NSS family neurotransmitter:Na+ symporter